MTQSNSPPSDHRINSWNRAARLSELAGAWGLNRDELPLEPLPDSELAEKLVARWREALRTKEDQWFEHRLQLDNLDRERLGALLIKIETASETDVWPEVELEEDWPEWIKAFATDAHADEVLPFVGDPIEGQKIASEAPFAAFLLPILRVAVARFHERLDQIAQTQELDDRADLPIRRPALARMVDALGHRLFAMVSPTLVLELNVARVQGRLDGEDAESRFRSFSRDFLAVEENRWAIYEEYSVLARLLVPAVQFWIQSMSELVDRFVSDRNEIASTIFSGADPGPICELDLSISDPHRQGRTVAILHLEDERKLVYKPKSLSIDVRFQDLLRWLAECGLEHPHRPLAVVAKNGYGWSEHVAAVPCEDPSGVERFYWRQGSFLALLYALYGCDFHYENLIAVGETPVLIDLESLFHNENLLIGEDAFTLASRRLLESVYGIGLLPLVTRQSRSGPSVDLGGMSGKGGVSGFDAPVLIDRRLDTMRFEKQIVTMPDKQNRPTLQGEEVNPLDHLAVFLQGFEATYDLLTSRKQELEAKVEAFADLPIRYIPRPTMRYMAFVQQTRHPDYLRRGIDQDRLLDHLWAEVDNREGLVPLIPSERDDIRVGDVPSFTSFPASRHLWNSRDQMIENQFEESSLDRVRRRVRGLCNADRDSQITLIKQTLLPLDFAGPTIAKPVAVRLPKRIAEPGDESYLHAALHLADRLAGQAILGPDDVSWIGAATTAGNHWEWMLTPLAPNLYDGLSGVGLFFGYLAEITGEARFKTLARRTVKSLTDHLAREETPLSVGAFSGDTGVLHTLHHLSTLWGEPEILTSALDLSLPRLIEDAATETGLDLMIGAAGGAIVALQLYEHLGDPRLLKLARACGNRLIEAAEPQEEGVGWVSGAASHALAGFSHGSAGIAWSLRRLSTHISDPRLLELADAALAFERSLYDQEQRNWRDVRDLETKQDDDPHPLAWCHGGPGVALGRMLTRPLLEAEQAQKMLQEMEIAAQETLIRGFGGNHSLCHGDMGNAEILLRLAEEFGESSWRRYALEHTTRVAAEVIAGTWKCGLPRHAETPGLMLGLSGIGYGLLRLAAPQRVPSVLDLSSPLPAAKTRR